MFGLGELTSLSELSIPVQVVLDISMALAALLGALSENAAVRATGAFDLTLTGSAQLERRHAENAGNRDVTFAVLPRGGHGLQALTADHECVSCPPDSMPGGWRFAPSAAELVDRWVLDRVGSK